jgi:uncharacterized protein (UPF0276 family)
MWDKFGWGLGLRSIHFDEWHKEQRVPVIEIMTDNLIHHEGGPALWHTEQITKRASEVVLHGVGLNIGGSSPISTRYLRGLRSLIERFNPKVVSDHLSFTEFGGLQSYELLPLERTTCTLEHVATRVDQVQQFLGRQISLENASAYVEYVNDSMPESEFMNQIVAKTGCGILLDVNNVYVNAFNFEKDPLASALSYDPAAIVQLHIAGHSVKADFLFDTHDSTVSAPVWNLLKDTLYHLVQNGKTMVPVILENDCPNTNLKALLTELTSAKKRLELRDESHSFPQGEKDDA